MKKIISIILVVLMLVSALSVTNFQAAVRNTDKTLGFDTGSVDWSNFSKVYCHIVDEDGNMFHTWQSENELCFDEDGDGVYIFNFTESGITLDNKTYYYVVFSNENGEQTYPYEFRAVDFGEVAYCTGEYVDDEDTSFPVVQLYCDRVLSSTQAINEYTQKTGNVIDTNRYYFLMPNGKNGNVGDDENGEYYGEYPPNWYNIYNEVPSVYWWGTGQVDPEEWYGFTLENGDSDNVFYGDVPVDAAFVIFNNSIKGGMEYDDPSNDFGMTTLDVYCEFYGEGENETYPDGVDSFENMIFVVDPDSNEETELYNRYTADGEWYYYYGNGCYGIDENGESDVAACCIRDDHHDEEGNHSKDYEKPNDDFAIEYESENGFKYRKIAYNMVEIVGYTGDVKNLVIPESIDGYIVESIGNEAFKGNTILQEVTVNKSVRYIGEKAFSGCENLVKIAVPSSVYSIGKYAFQGCSSLESFSFPYRTTKVEDYLFEDCISLKEVTDLSNVERIGVGAFSGCTSLEELTLYYLPRLNTYSLHDATGLKKLTFIDEDSVSCVISMHKETIPENAVIYAYSDTNAKKYADEFSREFVSLGDNLVTPTAVEETLPEPTENSTDEPTVKPSVKNYKEKFLEKYEDSIGWYDETEITYFEDAYLDEDNDGVTDYVIIYAHAPIAADSFYFADLGTHFISESCIYEPFGSGYALYDVKADRFLPFTKYMLEEYPFMVDYLKEHPVGTPYGDADGDNELTILDATEIQLGIAQLSTTGGWCYKIEGSSVYRSDIDHDGEITILDATDIQLVLAGIDNSEDDVNNELVLTIYDPVRYPNYYPAKPAGCKALGYEVKANSGYFGYSSKIAYECLDRNFMAVIKSQEQFEYVFDDSRYKDYDEDIFKTHWLVVSMAPTTCGEGVAKIDTVDVLGDTLYVNVDEYINVPEDGYFTEVVLSFISIVAVEKEHLADVTNIVRVR